MAYNQPNNIRENIEKESWWRSEQVMNILGLGQGYTIQGQLLQNPYFIKAGDEIMLEIVAPLFKEKEEVEEEVQGKDGVYTKKKRSVERVGKETGKYKNYQERLSLGTRLMNAALSKKYGNDDELLDSSYRIFTALKIDILQDIQDYGINFKSKPNKWEAYKEKEFQ